MKSHLSIHSGAASALAGAMRVLLFLVLPVIGGCIYSGAAKPSATPPSAVVENNRGVALMGQFAYEPARKVFAALSERYPDNETFRINLAVAVLNRQKEGDEPAALAMVRRVLEENPDNPRALYVAGLLELHAGHSEDALKRFDRVTAMDPSDTAAAYFRGKCLMQLSRHEEALSSFRTAMKGDPYLQSAYYGAVMALRNLRRPREAVDLIKTFKRLKNNPRAHLVEFKYRKMGPKANAAVIGSPLPALLGKPEGDLFGPAAPIGGTKVKWRGGDGGGSITACDMNRDGVVDLFVAGAVETEGGAGNAVLLGSAGPDRFRVSAGHPLSGVTAVNSVLWGDVDNDGLTDAYLLRNGENRLWLQRPGGEWRDMTGETGTGNGSFNTVDGALYDADHDGDLDLFLVNADGPNELLNNNRNGTFRALASEYGLEGTGRGRSLAVTDLDGDRDADIIVINEAPPHLVYRNDRLWAYEKAEGFEAFTGADIRAVVAGDLDADGEKELYALSGEGRPVLWTRDEKGVWGDRPLEQSGLEPADSMGLVDLDGDGRLEMIAFGAGGIWAATPEGGRLIPLFAEKETAWAAWTTVASGNGPLLAGWAPGGAPRLMPAGPGRYPFALISLSGVKETDDSWRSNASGIGALLTVRVGGRWTVMESIRNSSGPGQGLQPLWAGLGKSPKVDFAAIDWSDGVYQTELDLFPGKVHVVTETQRQLSSCPVLFAWDGDGYAFVSDLLGVGGIGYNIGNGEYGEPRPRESFMLPENLLKERDGRLSMKLTEPMEEVTYLDAVRLTAYDLPPGWNMTLDERMGIAGPQVTGGPRFFRRELLPAEAINDRGEEVTDTVVSRDLSAAPVGRVDRRFIGMLEREHVLTLTFDAPLDAFPGAPMLIADGWVEYPYSQTSFAAWQAGAVFHAPTLESRSPGGEWEVLAAEFGYPAGMPRQMSLPLPPLPPGAREIRIRTNQEIYWDRLAVAFAEPCGQMVKSALPLAEALVEQPGFPMRIDGPQRLPSYDFNRRSPVWDTRFLAGYYTEVGPAEPLLEHRDSAVAIFGPGEGVHLSFGAKDTPPMPGWKRIYVLETDGWCKDMDLFTNTGDTVAPVPSLEDKAPAAEALNRLYNTRYRFGRD